MLGASLFRSASAAASINTYRLSHHISLLKPIATYATATARKMSEQKQIQVGDKFPSGLTVTENNPGNKVSLDEFLKGKKVVWLAVPGAYTPGCHKTHLPGYIQDAQKIRDKGYNEIVCTAVNDAFVMNEWGKATGAEGKVRLFADADASVAKALGLSFNAPPLGGVRSIRYSAVIDDGKITQLNIEPDNTGLTCSLSSALKL
jgi:2-Cys peroxiredoxin 5